MEATWHGRADHAATAPSGGAAREVEDLVIAAVDAAREQGVKGLVVFVDEIQAGDPESLRTLSYAWQHFQSEQPDLPCALMAVGLPESVTVINKAVSNSERFAYRQLGDLPRDAAFMALARPAQQAGVRWEHSALERAVDYAAGYPHTVLLVGDSTWRQAGRPDPGATITGEHVEAALARVEADLDEVYPDCRRSPHPTTSASSTLSPASATAPSSDPTSHRPWARPRTTSACPAHASGGRGPSPTPDTGTSPSPSPVSPATCETP
ncbi:MAG: hypothetical protein WBL35_05025 [Ornithinibacter sp.]